MILDELVVLSGSPRRRELLEQIGCRVTVAPSPASEPRPAAGESPEAYALRTAQAKWSERSDPSDPRLRLSADTVVALDGRILGKPSDVHEAESMLRDLSGREHEVLTAVCVGRSQIELHWVSRARVAFASLDAPAMRVLMADTPTQYAGAYAIQSAAAPYSRLLEGEIGTVIGLPVHELLARCAALADHQPGPDTSLWRHIDRAAQLAAARLIAVSKLQPEQRVATLTEAGCRTLGENYLEGLRERRARFGTTVELHYIGALQTRKIPDIVAQADWIHGLSRLEEARKADQAEQKLNVRRRWLMQVNVGHEEQKGGVAPADAPSLWQQVRQQHPQLQLCGLMTIGPHYDEPELSAPHFAALRQMRDQIAAADPACRELSMGMSADWHIALRYGATMLRLGTLLFGTRTPQ